jgi:nitroreductase/FMN reductase [NAD(P)H]
MTEPKTIADLIERRFGLPATAGRDMPAEGPLARILSRRSQRTFKPDPVPEELLTVLLACAQSAPAKSDLQQYSIVVVQDPDVRRELGGQGKHLDWAAKAPVLLVFCGDVRRIRRLAALRGHAYANDNADTFMNAAVDAAIAFETFLLAAESVGLGCCGLSAVRFQIENTARALGLPEGVFPVAGMAVGWPADPATDTQRTSMRLPPEAVVHRDRYDDSGLEAAVQAYDARRHARQPILPEKQRHTDTYGALDRCPWSENVTRQLSLPERAAFREFLAKQGIHPD